MIISIANIIGSTSNSISVGGGASDDRFIFTVKTDNAGTSNDNQFTIPWIGTYDVDWGDGNVDTGVTDAQTHTYASAGTYDVAVTAATGKIEFRYVGDPLKLLDIKNWGTCQWTSLQNSFFGCQNLTNITATDTPDFSIMNSLKFSFYNCSNLISMDVSTWDVSNVIEAEVAFQSCVNLETLNGIENWTFQVLNINGLKSTFSNCQKFNSNIGGWTYVGPILSGVLNNCDMFNHSLANWDLRTVYFGSINILSNATGISQANYDATLISWASQSLPLNKTLNMGGSQYSYEAAAARQTLIDTYGWTIVDGGQAVSPEFALKWETTTPNEEIQIGVGSGTFDYTIDWGDGTVESYNTDANISHIYADAGDHITKITGDFPHINMGQNSITLAFKYKLKDILNWGSQTWGSLENGFRNCDRLTTVTVTDSPNLSICTSLRTIFDNLNDLVSIDSLSLWDVSNIQDFSNSLSFGYNKTLPDITQWDVSNATDMSGMFTNTNFNQDISSWDVSNVTNMNNMFAGTNFNQDISSWNVSNVTITLYMFRNNSVFNQDISGWSFNNLQTCYGMFEDATSFNQDISNWDMSNVINVNFMFEGATSFNQPVGLWTTSNLQGANRAFNGATSFDQSLANWDISQIPDNPKSYQGFPNFLNGVALSTANYDDTLISWASQTTGQNVTANFGNSQYTLGGAAEAARNTLINTYGWTITDGGGIFVGLLDEYPNAAAAYSLRDLSTAFVGSPVVRVRRSSDNTEQDFTATEITDGTLTTFTGANDGFVTTWYDQSGNSNNLSTASALNQSKIISSGVLNLDNGKPFIEIETTDNDCWRSPLNIGLNSTSATLFAIYNSNDVSSNGCLLSQDNSSLSFFIFQNGSSVKVDRDVGVNTNSYKNGNLLGLSITRDLAFDEFVLGQDALLSCENIDFSVNIQWATSYISPFNYRASGIFTQNNKAKEFIIYNNDQTANRTAIETNINNHYSIY